MDAEGDVLNESFSPSAEAVQIGMMSVVLSHRS